MNTKALIICSMLGNISTINYLLIYHLRWEGSDREREAEIENVYLYVYFFFLLSKIKGKNSYSYDLFDVILFSNIFFRQICSERFSKLLRKKKK